MTLSDIDSVKAASQAASSGEGDSGMNGSGAGDSVRHGSEAADSGMKGSLATAPDGMALEMAARCWSSMTSTRFTAMSRRLKE